MFVETTSLLGNKLAVKFDRLWNLDYAYTVCFDDENKSGEAMDNQTCTINR